MYAEYPRKSADIRRLFLLHFLIRHWTFSSFVRLSLDATLRPPINRFESIGSLEAYAKNATARQRRVGGGDLKSSVNLITDFGRVFFSFRLCSIQRAQFPFEYPSGLTGADSGRRRDEIFRTDSVNILSGSAHSGQRVIQFSFLFFFPQRFSNGRKKNQSAFRSPTAIRRRNNFLLKCGATFPGFKSQKKRKKINRMRNE